MNIPELYQIYKQHPEICTDSRHISVGSLFFALKGERFNGNAYAHQAIQSGAAYAVVDEPAFATSSRIILVVDVLTTLQQLANFHRKQIQIPILAVGGSNGKTTSKELLHAVLSLKYDTLSTSGNLNNHIGVALTILRIKAHHQIAVIEMGANHLHETMQLCHIAEPTMGVVTNNGKDHLEGFGSIEGVRKANAELFEYLKSQNGFAFVNADQADLMLDSKDIRRFTYSLSTPSDYCCCIVSKDHFASILLPGGILVKSQLAGNFNAVNIALAAAIGHHFGIDENEMAHAIKNYSPRINRSQIIEYKGATIIMDAYNANPSSMELALQSYAQMTGNNKAVILADMLELGPYTQEEHLRIVKLLSTLPLQQIILIGPAFGQFAHLLQCLHFNNTASATDWFKEQDFSGWHILLKGSRGYKLETIIN